MTIHKLLLHEGIGEIRAAALDKAGRPLALFQDRLVERGKRLRWGEIRGGHIRKLSPHDGGAFIALEGGLEGFLPRRDITRLVQGAHGVWRVMAEARAGKLAKLAEADAETETETEVSVLEKWRASLRSEATLEFESPAAAARIIDAAFQDALCSIVPLAGGGRLQITPALVAVDVDTIGRKDKGRASARAKAVGLVAAEEAARQAVLRGLGGAIVLDCISPLSRRDGPELKKRFVKTVKAVSDRRVDCLPPSPFGLMEAVLSWRWQPLQEAYFDRAGDALPLAVLLDGLRQIEKAALANPADRLCLALPDGAFKTFNAEKNMYETALMQRFGRRIMVQRSSREQIEVSNL